MYEKIESAFFLAAGLSAILISILIFVKFAGYRGMIIPLVAIGLIQIIVGGAVFFRTDAQVDGLNEKLSVNSQEYKSEELARMDAVMKNFRIYKSIETGLVLLGIALSLIFQKRDFLYSLGIGLILQPVIMLVLELIAEKRASVYIDLIRTLL